MSVERNQAPIPTSAATSNARRVARAIRPVSRQAVCDPDKRRKRNPRMSQRLGPAETGGGEPDVAASTRNNIDDVALSKASGGNTKENKAVDVVDDASEQRLRPLREVGAGG